ncbi:MAG: type II toxin-antitoxin system Phd/YefM family antitoxin [Candidatus Parabeggiatoa sp. nov. 2]|nr:MAG: type II toxin-antitoxin system Phd/YefM family antitoxin [Gammaproteobacteria bacterium]
MNVYTFSEARQQLAILLERARVDGEVHIKRRDGQLFVLKPVQSTRSPLDVLGVNLDLSSDDIVDIVRQLREKG